MNNANFENRMISTRRNIRQRCQLKYSKHGTFSWDKWIEYDCIFSSFVDNDEKQHNRLELHSRNNLQEPNGKVIDLKGLHSITSIHGNIVKKEPKDIIILKIGGKKHRLGFDHIYDYNQWKTLLDGVYNSGWDMTNRDRPDENPSVNMLYESASAMRYRVKFADLATQEVLCLPGSDCELIFDADKLILEQRHDKQYTFPRSTIRTIRLINDEEIEFELGSRAPVQGFIRFRFESPVDTRSCYSQWNEGVVKIDTYNPKRRSTLDTSQYIEHPIIPPRAPLEQKYSYQAARPSPRSVSNRSPYYDSNSPVPLMTTTVTQNEYSAFHTLV
ncbi:unnamed protein product [Adineta steineri]|uniref:Uncharacterized protein n=2 Tax=Adineta steineri TaxID=433720 RepID=A0A818T2H7_9BILA|nr:unnamed protein product [Adineta steineri]